MPDVSAGEHLRQLRNRVGLTTRQVADLSHKIASAEGDEEYAISHGRLIQIENGESTPSIYKLFTLSAVYGVSFHTTVSFYADLANIAKHQAGLALEQTRRVDFPACHEECAVRFPMRFDPGLSAERTNLLSRMVQEWGDLPISFFRGLNVRDTAYGFIGLGDYTMYPLLSPGSFVQIEVMEKPTKGKEASRDLLPWTRPIWFLELHDGYLCSWCEFYEGRIVSVPHPNSPCKVREYGWPGEAELIGRVSAVAARLVNHAAEPWNVRPPTQR